MQEGARKVWEKVTTTAKNKTRKKISEAPQKTQTEEPTIEQLNREQPIR